MAHIIVFAGEYDLANKDGLRRTLRRLESSNNHLVLDLTEVTFIDSTFISELLLLEKRREAQNFSRVTIVAPADSIVRRVFDIVGIAPILTLVESYDDPRVGADHVVEFAVSGDELDATAEQYEEIQ